MKINSEQKCNKKKNRNRKRSKKRRGNKKKFKYHKSRIVKRDRMPVHSIRMNGESYWMNYNNVIRWQRNYLDYINSCHLSPETSFVLNTGSLSTPDSGTQTIDFTSDEVIDFGNESNSECHDSVYDENEEEEEEEFEVTEEMMNFLEQSMKHKEAMKLMKAEAELVSNESKEIEEASEEVLGRVRTSGKMRRRLPLISAKYMFFFDATEPFLMKPMKYVAISSEKCCGVLNSGYNSDDIEECQTPKGNMIDEKRISEMSRLYGKSSPMILGMETALQLSFNKNCDVYKPAFWPCLPLKIQFSNK